MTPFQQHLQPTGQLGLPHARRCFSILLGYCCLSTVALAPQTMINWPQCTFPIPLSPSTLINTLFHADHHEHAKTRSLANNVSHGYCRCVINWPYSYLSLMPNPANYNFHSTTLSATVWLLGEIVTRYVVKHSSFLYWFLMAIQICCLVHLVKTKIHTIQYVVNSSLSACLLLTPCKI